MTAHVATSAPSGKDKSWFSVRLNCWQLFVSEKGEEFLPSVSLHSQRFASLESHCLFYLLLFVLHSLLLPFLHLLIDHHPHVLLQQDRKENPCVAKRHHLEFWVHEQRPTCQASSSWDSATFCLMVLRSCWVRDSFSWHTVANSLSKELNIDEHGN